jgi:multiple sugar transport system substrate-binding protein
MRGLNRSLYTLLTRQLGRICKMNQQYCFVKTSLAAVIALLMISTITTSSILEPALGTAANLPSNNATTYHDNNADSKYDSFTLVPSNQSSTSTIPDRTNVTLIGIFGGLEDNPGRWKWNILLQPALDELNRRHPDMNIQLKYDSSRFYNETKNIIIDKISANGSSNNPVDIVFLDQIWLGELAGKGLLTNLTANFEQWGRMDDLYEANLDGTAYNNTIYGLWLWTDVRGMWYWKDMLQEAGVDPESLKTWDGYISAAVMLKDFFGERVKQGVVLNALSYDPDLWYPYLWMLGGEILELREGHPTKGVYWFPSFNSSEGVKALEYLKQQVDAGIKPQTEPTLGADFANRSFPALLEGSWLPREFANESKSTFERQVGFIPMFPVPNQTIPTSTMMGGWELAIPSTSQHSDLSWELITILAEPEILAPFLQEYGFLPTQKTLGEGPASELLKDSIPYFEQMVSMIPYGRSRPNLSEYPEIAEYIHQAIHQVYNESASAEDALNVAAAKSAASLGWKMDQ